MKKSVITEIFPKVEKVDKFSIISLRGKKSKKTDFFPREEKVYPFGDKKAISLTVNGGKKSGLMGRPLFLPLSVDQRRRKKSEKKCEKTEAQNGMSQKECRRLDTLSPVKSSTG